MQALKRKTVQYPAKLLVFPTPMSTPPIHPTPPEHQPAWNPHKHGNLAQWAAPFITLLIGIISVSLMVHYRNIDSAAKSSNEHINGLIDDKLNPAKTEINSKIDAKTDELGKKIDLLSNRISQVDGKLGLQISDLKTKADQQSSLARLMDPNRTLALIRAEVEMAETRGAQLPAPTMADYRNAVQKLHY